jgi:hypothetical protein
VLPDLRCPRRNITSSKKNHGPAPIPPGNRPHSGPLIGPGHPLDSESGEDQTDGGAGFQEQDAQRRLGDYATEGEHPIQQPTRLNDGQQHAARAKKHGRRNTT